MVAEDAGAPQRKMLPVQYLVSLLAAKESRSFLEREGLPYSLKPYHLNDFLEKVSDLLVDAGAIAEPIRAHSFGGQKAPRPPRLTESGRGVMFASRKDYQMTEEEIAEYERDEEVERKKREQKDRERR